MTFRDEVSAQAESDAEAILDWLLSQHAGETGIRWFLAPARLPLISAFLKTEQGAHNSKKAD